MKVKKFSLDKGKHVVVAHFVKINDTTKAEDDTTLRTDEAPLPALREAFQNLALSARDFWRLRDLKLKVVTISFSENNDGKGARLMMESVDEEHPLTVGPLKIKRELEFKAGENTRLEGSLRNPLLDDIDHAENEIIQYLNGSRLQPELKEPAQVEPRPRQGRLAYMGEKIAEAGAKIAGRGRKEKIAQAAAVLSQE